jgi:hypothetical protein
MRGTSGLELLHRSSWIANQNDPATLPGCPVGAPQLVRCGFSLPRIAVGALEGLPAPLTEK